MSIILLYHKSQVDDDKLMQMIWDSLLHLLNNCSFIDELGDTIAELRFGDASLSTGRSTGGSAGVPVFRQRRQTTS